MTAKRANLVVRGAGIALVAVAGMIVAALTHSPTFQDRSGPTGIEAMLAVIAFLCASIGMASACLGRGLFQPVAVTSNGSAATRRRRGRLAIATNPPAMQGSRMTYDPDRKAPLNAGRPKAAKPPHERVTGRLSLRNAASIRRPGDAPIR